MEIEHFWLLLSVPGIVCHSISSQHPYYRFSELVWRLIFSLRRSLYYCKVPSLLLWTLIVCSLHLIISYCCDFVLVWCSNTGPWVGFCSLHVNVSQLVAGKIRPSSSIPSLSCPPMSSPAMSNYIPANSSLDVQHYHVQSCNFGGPDSWSCLRASRVVKMSSFHEARICRLAVFRVAVSCRINKELFESTLFLNQSLLHSSTLLPG